jgi:hypothetical protein
MKTLPLERVRYQCEESTKGSCEMVMPKEEEGLGLIGLEKHNEALILKNVHKIFNNLDISWVQLSTKEYEHKKELVMQPYSYSKMYKMQEKGIHYLWMRSRSLGMSPDVTS